MGEYTAAYHDMLTDFWRNDGEFAALDEEAGAVAAAKSITTAPQEITDRGDTEIAERLHRRSDRESTIPRRTLLHLGRPCSGWHAQFYALLGSLRLCLLIDSDRPEAWKGIVDEAAAYSSSIGCPMALVSAVDFLDFGTRVHFESIRDQGKLRCFDTLEKVVDFRKTFLIVNLSHHLDVNGVLYRIMCAAVRGAINAANLTSDLVFLSVDYCSIPQ